MVRFYPIFGLFIGGLLSWVQLGELGAQVRLRVTVNSGSSGTVCTDGFLGGAPEPHWRVNIAGQGWTTYPRAGLCFTNPPNTQYDETFDCPNQYPAQLNICYRAFEDDGGACVVSEDCIETLCQNFPTPAPGTSATYSMTIPNNGSNRSWGTVNFTVSATGAFNLPGFANDQICDAINLGTLSSGGSLGNRNLSNYGNFCATNTGDASTPWSNQQGVWFRFTTGASPSAVIEFEATNDPQNRGRSINLQMALYESSNGTCSGTLTRLESSYTLPLFGEEMSVNCLRPNTTYFLLVDGEDLPLLGGGIGYFGLQINDNGIRQAADQICSAEALGTVPNGGAWIGTSPLSRSNVCATNTNDPTPPIWGPLQPVWFSIVAPASGNVIVEATSDLPFPFGTDAIDLQLALYGSNNGLCNGTLQYLGGSYNPIGFDEEMNVRCLTPGETYWIMVDGSGLNRDGIFGIRARDGGIPPAPNDNICDAIALGAPAPGATVGLNNQNNYCANNIMEPSPSNWGNVQGVWYTFVAPPSGKVEVRASSDGFFGDPIDLQLAVYDSDNMTCTGVLREVRSEYEGLGLLWDEDMEVECLIPGRTYYILVDGQGSLINPGLQEGIFDISVYADPRDPAGPNDLICNAIDLGDPTGVQRRTGPGPGRGSQNNFCATAAGEPNPSSFTPSQTVWYRFIAPASGNVRIRGISDAVLGGVDPINLQFAVWEASNNNCTGGVFREIQSGDDILYDIDMEVYCLDPGRPYYLQVDGSPPAFLGGHEGYFDIILDELPPIPVAVNDLICDAIDLGDPWTSGATTLTNQHNLCADDIGDPQPSEFSTDQTVWYRVQTPATGGPYSLRVEATSSLPWPLGNRDAIDLQLAVWSSSNNSCTGTLTELGSSYFPIPFNENITVPCLEAGRTYFIMVDGSFIDMQGYFDISVSPATPVPIPVNDDLCDAVDLGNVPIAGAINNGVDYFNFCASTEPGEPSPWGIRQTVWFSFVAPAHPGPNATSNVRVRVNSDPGNVGNDVDLRLAVYESSNNLCTGTMRLLDDDDPLLTRNAEVDLTCLFPGRRYFVQVDGTTFDRDGYFRISVQDQGAGLRPTNDAICQATNLGAVPNGGQINDGVNYFNLCASTQAGEPNPSAFGIEQTVWFQFQAPSSGNVTIFLRNDPNNVGDEIDLQLAVYQAANNNCAGPFIEIDSRYNAFGFDEQLSLECLVPGGTYFIQVDGASGLLGGQEGYFTIRIRDDGGVSNFPYNNDICNAYNFGTPTGSWSTRNNETTECANVEFGEPGVGGYATNTVWYQFTAPPSARVRIEVTSTNLLFGMDPEVYLFSSSNNSCSGSFSQIGRSNFPTALITEVIEATCLIPGQTYFIQVDGSGLNVEGTFNIRVRDMFPNYGTGLPGDPQPSNNLCGNAIPLAVQTSSCINGGSGSFQMLNYGYPTITHNTPFVRGCNTNCGDTWYSFTMPSTGVVSVNGNDNNVGGGVIGDFSELTILAYTGTCNNLSPIDCDRGGLTTNPGLEIAAPPGSTVYLQIFNHRGDDDGENYELCISQGCGADNCLNALAYPISPNIPYCFNTAGASGENVIGGQPGYFNCGRNTNPVRSLYYSFVSDCNGSDVTISIINARSNAGCLLGTVPQDGFSVSFFEDATPCDNNPDLFIDCQTFNSCMAQPINWAQTYTNLRPNTNYIIQIEGGFNFLGGPNNDGQVMIQTQTSPTVLPVSTALSCSGLPDGTASALVVGGVSPFSFVWSNGATDSTISNLPSGQYFVTATAANGCEDTASVFVPGPNNTLNTNISTFSNVTCHGACDGTATATGVGGTLITGYTYQWDAAAGGQTTGQATGLCPGIYSVTVSDNGGCSGITSVTITEPAPMNLSLVNSTDAACAGVCDGTAEVLASGGQIAFQHRYNWSNGMTGSSVTGLCAGTYTVTALDDINCSAVVTVTINQPTGVTAVLANQTNILCTGDNTGSAQVTAGAGTAPYEYSLDGTSFGSSSSFTGLTAGSYTITVRDVNGCEAYVPFTLTEPTPLSLSLISSMDASCQGATDGMISLSADAGSGTAPYEYSLDGLNYQASGTFNNLGAGSYTATVRDANACISSLMVDILEPAGINLSLLNQTTADCGFCNASAQISASGGAGAYTFLWTNGETNATATALCSGNALVTVTDANGCTASLGVNILNSGNLTVNAQTLQEISCFGACDGALSITPLGGTAPYNYAWSNGHTGSSTNNLCPGTYQVTLTDANACLVVQNFILQAPTPLSASIALIGGPSCPGVADAQAIITGSGGTTPYSFLWSDGHGLAQNDNLSAGNYSITLTDANACTATANIQIQDPVGLSVSITSVTASDCGTNCTGTAQINVSGGTAPYTYAWTNGQSSANASALCSGFQALTVTDANGCTATDNINIPSSTGLILAVQSLTLPSCFGDCDGAVSVAASGGTLPYQYTWSQGANTSTANGLCEGQYLVSVTDNAGCIAALAVDLLNPPVLLASISITSDYNGQALSCHNSTDGQMSAQVSGGTGAYSFVWSNGQTLAQTNGLGAGTTSLTVTDVNGCQATASETISAPAPILVTANVTSDYNGAMLSCFGGSDATAEAQASGGTGTLSYLWPNGQTTANVTGLAAGTHSVTISDLNACQAIASVTVTPPSELIASIVADVTYQGGFQVSCQGASDGAIRVIAQQGTGAYRYFWSNGETTVNLTGLAAGTYSVTVLDDNNCGTSAFFTLTAPPALSVSASVLQQVSCNGLSNGQALAQTQGGVAPYSFAWANGETTAQASGLNAASHSLTVTDANGCTAVGSVLMTEPPLLSVQFTNIQAALCQGGNSGAATANATGGIPAYTYSWSNGFFGPSPTSLAAGSYTVTASDANNCTATAVVSISEPSAITATTAVTSNYNGQQLSCSYSSDGQAQVQVSGGTGPYTYLWINGQTSAQVFGLQASNYPVTVTDANGCVRITAVNLVAPSPINLNTTILSSYRGFDVSCANGNDGIVRANASSGTGTLSYLWSDGQTTSTATGMNAGEYAVTVTDINGCIAMDTDTLRAPAPLSLSLASSSQVSCHGGNNGQAFISASGGISPYSFIWSDGASTQNRINLSAGSYTLSLTDANGCRADLSFNISQPPSLSAVASSVMVSCVGTNDGQASVIANGGTPNYTYLWSNGATASNLNGLAAGTYRVTVTDANSCVITATTTVGQPPVVGASISVTGIVSCAGGNNASLQATVSTGTPPYSFLWSNGATTATLNNLSAGVYNLTVTDQRGCQALRSVTLTEPSAVNASAQITSNYNGSALSCNGAADGRAQATASGGTAPYTFLWSNGQTTAQATGLEANVYIVQVTDARGCTDTAMVHLFGPPPLEHEVRTLADVPCFGQSNGSALADVSGGTPGYTFQWSNGETTQIAVNLTATQHFVTITDRNGCSVTNAVSINEPPFLGSTGAYQQAVTCHGGNNGMAYAAFSGGQGIYTYQWSNGATTMVASGLTAGWYGVTVTDENGCTARDSVRVLQPQPITLDMILLSSASCQGRNDGSATAIVLGGQGPFNFRWDRGNRDSIATTLGGGWHILTVFDVNGCEGRDSIFVPAPDAIDAQIQSSDISCAGLNNGTASVSLSGGTAPYNYAWSNGATTPQVSGLEPGFVFVTVSDASGCSVLLSAFLRQPANFTAQFLNAEDPSCDGANDGYIRVQAAGGQGNFVFQWSHGPVDSNGTNISSFNDLRAGLYGITVTDAGGCSLRLDTFLSEPSPLRLSGTGNRTRCYNSTDGRIEASAQGGTPPYSYRILPRGSLQAEPIFTGLMGGEHIIQVFDALGCMAQTTVRISRPDSVRLVVPDSFDIEMGDSAQLFVRMPVNAPYNPIVTWSPAQGLSCADCYQPVARPTQTTYYTVTIVGDDNCPVQSGVLVKVRENYDVFIPNAFTPNGDGLNDVFMVYSRGQVASMRRMMVFDRWGELLFESRDGRPNFPAFGWDGTFRGKPMNTGVYVYFIEIEFLDGRVEIFKGDITLFR